MVNPIFIKIICPCGQKYAFEVYPAHGRMPAPVFCPVCGCEGTAEANRVIAQKAPPPALPAVATVLNAAQFQLAPQIIEALKNAVVQELASQRRELLQSHQAATAELTELARRLEQVQAPLIERLRTYETRIGELEKILSEQTQENRELLKIKIEETRRQMEAERGWAGF
ncbi:MAG TPA: hypothetical protein VFC85_09070 [Verrucomicrobiae bacterium]|nr:hypothetical protein [Verrucomicrobiae bacterium]